MDMEFDVVTARIQYNSFNLKTIAVISGRERLQVRLK